MNIVRTLAGARLRANILPPQSSHLHWVDPGLGAADALNRGDSGSVKLADR